MRRTSVASSGYGAAVALDQAEEARRGDRHAGQARREDLARVGDERAVEGAGDRDASRGDARGLEARDGGVDARGGAGDDRLIGGVDVGDHHAVEALEVGRDARRRGGHGGHGPRLGAGGLEDGLAARRAERQELGLGDRARERQGRELAVAVAGEHVGLHPEGDEQLREREAGDAERGLGDAGVGERGRLRRAIRGELRHGREDAAGPRLAEGEEALEAREGDEDLAEHAHPLAALAGEEEGDLAGGGVGLAARTEVHAARRLRRGAPADDRGRGEGAGPPELLEELVGVSGDDRDLHRAATLGDRAREVGEAGAGRAGSPPRRPRAAR